MDYHILKKTVGPVNIHPQVIFDHNFSFTLYLSARIDIFLHPSQLYWDRLVVTEVAQCGAWNAWCSAYKRSRNAKTSSDPVQFFLHALTTDAYSDFNMQAALYAHFEPLLGTP